MRDKDQVNRTHSLFAVVVVVVVVVFCVFLGALCRSCFVCLASFRWSSASVRCFSGVPFFDPALLFFLGLF